ncbi:ClpP/crotonase [Metschnikowia bicuspidata var. bicuspidata NRRL YB-4993]|uniref:ClpP/crotonase n=1 Tax=Metschnikowia bicuspidata var. bicuspidata NRRL YB-4993 TaxID=869754 RepID=A0A1A0HDF2_9ASCO|nr:ClpP/crotonase [Metschnikowia bicuspidata var. bicuspidata NRRL YB-4993]OBA22046.1 ClpP/crotonase [Metschnikowia bicuspidata var. bicuspidata NRRL YB-4993]
MSHEDTITYAVRGRVTVITLNIPHKLNALNGQQYLQLAKYLQQADDEEDTVCTLLQSTGRYFSAGANFADKALTKAGPDVMFSHEYWLQNFAGRNVYLTDLCHNHKKVLVAALNGPVIGLSSAMVAFCDIVYAIDEDRVNLLAPFSNLGLVAEGGTSATFFLRLGWSKSAEALLFAKPVSGQDLNRLGFFNKVYNGKNYSTEEFNKVVFEDLVSKFDGLYEPSIFANKQLLKANRDQMVNSANAKEAIVGFNRWIEGVPQGRFVEMANKERKHKM